MKRITTILLAALMACAGHAQTKLQQPLLGGGGQESTPQKKVYNEQIDPMAQIDQALAQARTQGKYVVCQVGGNWCPWCLRLADFIRRDSTVARVIDDNFQSVHFSSTTTAVANRFAEAARGSKRNTLYAYRHENMMELFVFRAGRLQLGNRFTTIGVEDAAYYVMLAVKTLGMNVDEDEFNIIESANEEGSLTKRLHDFVNDVKQEEFRNAFGRTPLADAKNLTYDMAAFLMQPY